MASTILILAALFGAAAARFWSVRSLDLLDDDDR
jgi:hypothetical protein